MGDGALTAGDRLVLSPPRWVKWRSTTILAILTVAFLIGFLRPSPARILALLVVFLFTLPVMLAHRAEVSIDAVGVRRGRRTVAWSDVEEVDTRASVVRTRRRDIRLPGRLDPADLTGLVPPDVNVT